jgi:hypothetical protein
MKNERLQHTIDLLKRCGEEKGMTITEEEMAGKIDMPIVSGSGLEILRIFIAASFTTTAPRKYLEETFGGNRNKYG